MEFAKLAKTSKTDEWYTPRYAVELIVPYIQRNKFKKVWCPFDTEKSEFVKTLNRYGIDVIYSHISFGDDFFKFKNPPEGVDCIVSNPPFSRQNEIFKKLFGWDLPFAIIANSNGLFDAKARWEMFRKNQFELLIPNRRIHFSDGKCVKNSPPFQCFYVCHNFLDEKMVFAEMPDIKGAI
jgi:hypothetical protein